jgi:large subunit ribosomal protein L10
VTTPRKDPRGGIGGSITGAAKTRKGPKVDFEEKQQKSQRLREELAGASAVVIVAFSRLTVEAADELRAKFREAECVYRVHKNSTIRFAVEGTPHGSLKEFLRGVSGLAYNYDDPAAPARVARAFAKRNDSFQIKGGVMEGELLDEAGVGRLADLPGPRELKAQVLSLFNAPASKMVRVLSAAPQAFLQVLTAKKEADAA